MNWKSLGWLVTHRRYHLREEDCHEEKDCLKDCHVEKDWHFSSSFASQVED